MKVAQKRVTNLIGISVGDSRFKNFPKFRCLLFFLIFLIFFNFFFYISHIYTCQKNSRSFCSISLHGVEIYQPNFCFKRNSDITSVVNNN